MKLGAHLSLGTNPWASLQEAHARGASCAQIFASSPGAWKPPLPSERKVTDIARARAELDVDPFFIHAIYLINLASEDQTLVRRSRGSLVATMHAGAALGAMAVVTHLGSHAGRGFGSVAQLVADGLLEVLDTTSPGILLALENSAGAGGVLGSDLQELRELLDLARWPDRLRVALDTAHLCAAGWDFSAPGVAERLVEEIEASVGLHRLAVVHCNDSRAPCGSRRDRHACVGEGYVGMEGFRRLLAQPSLRRVPWVLETPDLDTRLDPARRFRSLDTLRSLACESLA